MDEEAKIYIGLVLVILALTEFFTAMYLFGVKPSKDSPHKFAKLAIRAHRILGYVFLMVFALLIYMGVVILNRLAVSGTGYQFNGARFFHALLAVVMFLVLLLKIGFIRIWRNYRSQARLLGFIVTIGALTIWLISGWFYLIMMGGWTVER